MEDFMIGLTWLGLFAGAFLAWYYFLQARTKERTLLIEKGADASNFYAKKPERKGWKLRFPWLKLGLLLCGLGLGLGLGLLAISVPEVKEALRHVAPGVVFASTFIFGGLAMIVAHFVDRSKQN